MTEKFLKGYIKQGLNSICGLCNFHKLLPPKSKAVPNSKSFQKAAKKKSCRKKAENDKNITFKKIEV